MVNTTFFSEFAKFIALVKMPSAIDSSASPLTIAGTLYVAINLSLFVSSTHCV